MRRDVFQAIADPTRREILSLLSQERLNINAVSDHFEVSRTAIYKHLKILSECGLLTIRPEGRERFCEARLNKLKEVSDWVEQYSTFWTSKLDALARYLDETKPNKKKITSRKNPKR